MLEIFKEFREKLDDVMTKAFGHRIVLWGYGYTGQFLEWYAEYYHSLKMDFVITEEWSSVIPYKFPLFRNSIFDFNYMDVNNSMVWLAIPEDEIVSEKLAAMNLQKNVDYFNFLEIIYGDNYINNAEVSKNVFGFKRRVCAIFSLWNGWNTCMIVI